ncbi:MAG: zf-TFIIB domain-containing protein, partial [Thermomicrobium sp.]
SRQEGDVATFVCPKCLGRMQTVERNGIIFERCEECGGIFLDRGELEQLVRAETMYYRTTASRWTSEREDEEKDWHGKRKRKKFRHFLEEILDFD